MTDRTLLIYGAGDYGTKLLIDLCQRKSVKYEFLDIRKSDVNGVKSNLAKLQNMGHRDVPHVYRRMGDSVVTTVMYAGDCQKVSAELLALPNPEKQPLTA